MSLRLKAGLAAYYAAFLAIVAFSETAQGPTTLPITRVSNAIFVQATIEGKTANLLVDSGASTTLILDRAMAPRIGLRGKGAGSLKGAGNGNCRNSRLSETAVMLGDRTISAPDVFASDLCSIPARPRLQLR
jgi:predicted aspartyl protease